jgi:kinesin family protein 11
MLDEEVEKEIIEEKRVCVVDQCSTIIRVEQTPSPPSRSPRKRDHPKERFEGRLMGSELSSEPENSKDTASSRRLRIQNIFTLCGNHREFSQHINTPTPAKKRSRPIDPQSSPIGEDSIVRNFNKENLEVQKYMPIPEFEAKSPAATMEPYALNKNQIYNDVALALKENYNPYDDNEAKVEVYVKWDASKEIPGKFITTLKVVKDASLADLRKLIEISLGADN